MCVAFVGEQGGNFDFIHIICQIVHIYYNHLASIIKGIVTFIAIHIIFKHLAKEFGNNVVDVGSASMVQVVIISQSRQLQATLNTFGIQVGDMVINNLEFSL